MSKHTEGNDLAASNPEPPQSPANPPLSAPTNTDEQLNMLWHTFHPFDKAKTLDNWNRLIVQKQIEELENVPNDAKVGQYKIDRIAQLKGDTK
jgi:hypothetical protein